MAAETSIKGLENNLEEISTKMYVISGLANSVWLSLVAGIKTEHAEHAMEGVCNDIQETINELEKITSTVCTLRQALE